MSIKSQKKYPSCPTCGLPHTETVLNRLQCGEKFRCSHCGIMMNGNHLRATQKSTCCHVCGLPHTETVLNRLAAGEKIICIYCGR